MITWKIIGLAVLALTYSFGMLGMMAMQAAYGTGKPKFLDVAFWPWALIRDNFLRQDDGP